MAFEDIADHQDDSWPPPELREFVQGLSQYLDTVAPIMRELELRGIRLPVTESLLVDISKKKIVIMPLIRKIKEAREEMLSFLQQEEEAKLKKDGVH